MSRTTTKSNAETFLNLFYDIEQYLKNTYHNGRYESFSKMIREAAQDNPLFKRYRDELLSYADLRNAIVHNRRIDGAPIAEPHSKVVANFRRIWNEIQNPEKVTIFKKQVYTCKHTDCLEKALGLMKEHMISQIPILKNGVLTDVLNGNGIAHWLANSGVDNIKQTPISEVLAWAEYSNNYSVVSEKTSAHKAAEIYQRSFKQAPINWYYDAILITPTGKPTDVITGIIVLADITPFMHD